MYLKVVFRNQLHLSQDGFSPGGGIVPYQIVVKYLGPNSLLLQGVTVEDRDEVVLLRYSGGGKIYFAREMIVSLEEQESGVSGIKPI